MSGAQTSKSTRKANDFYPTASFFTHLLMAKVPVIHGEVGEPFVGNGAIARVLQEYGRVNLAWTNDLVAYEGWERDSAIDLSIPANWGEVPILDGHVTNPPFDILNNVWALENLYAACDKFMGLLVRQTWVHAGCGESGTHPRGEWLEAHPPTKVIVLPRYNWADSTKNGRPQADAAAHYWLFWDKTHQWLPEVPYELVTGKNIPGWKQRTDTSLLVRDPALYYQSGLFDERHRDPELPPNRSLPISDSSGDDR